MSDIPIPAERVPPIATKAAKASKAFAAALVVLSVIAVIGGISVIAEGLPAKTREAVETVLAAIVIPLLFAIYSVREMRNAIRAIRAADSDASRRYTWQLSDKRLIATGSDGAPDPDLSFTISDKLRTLLLALPRAEVVDRHG